jgi:uncharacterized protein (TIGR03067 family)
MRRFMTALAFLAVTLPAVADDKDKDGGDDKLVGKWVPTRFLNVGFDNPFPGGEMVAFSNDGMWTQKEGSNVFEGTWMADPSKDFRWLDLTGPSPDKTKKITLKTIYKVEGDTLTVASPTSGLGGERPTTFDPKQAAVLTLKRQKP